MSASSSTFTEPFTTLCNGSKFSYTRSADISPSYFICERSKSHRVRRRPRVSVFMASDPGRNSGSASGNDMSGSNSGNAPDSNEMDEWFGALEEMFTEALVSYYEGAPMFTDAEFNALRDELEHLAAAQMRLGSMEKVWVQATSARDFDRRVRKELRMSEEELDAIKRKLVADPRVARRRRRSSPQQHDVRFRLPAAPPVVKDAETIDATERVDERIRWLLFGDATQERLKVALLYLPAVLMSFVTASMLTILFALLDGEMKIYVTKAGRVRLGVLSYVVVMLTVWFSNKVTPVMLDFLDLGQPTLLRAECPNCSSPVSCLFTGAARNRDERKCRVCGAIVGFNRKWSKVYLVAPPGDATYSQPD